jgi:hypothetical protein
VGAGALSRREVKRPEREFGHSPPSGDEVGGCASPPQYASVVWCLIKKTGTTLPLPGRRSVCFIFVRKRSGFVESTDITKVKESALLLLMESG